MDKETKEAFETLDRVETAHGSWLAQQAAQEIEDLILNDGAIDSTARVINPTPHQLPRGGNDE